MHVNKYRFYPKQRKMRDMTVLPTKVDDQIGQGYSKDDDSIKFIQWNRMGNKESNQHNYIFSGRPHYEYLK